MHVLKQLMAMCHLKLHQCIVISFTLSNCAFAKAAHIDSQVSKLHRLAPHCQTYSSWSKQIYWWTIHCVFQCVPFASMQCGEPWFLCHQATQAMVGTHICCSFCDHLLAIFTHFLSLDYTSSPDFIVNLSVDYTWSPDFIVEPLHRLMITGAKSKENLEFSHFCW